ARDFDGKPIVAPWMKSWGAKWVTTASSHTRKALYEWVDKYVAAGFDSIQFDDPVLEAGTVLWGAGDFSDASLAGFGRYVQYELAPSEKRALGIIDGSSPFDLRSYLRERGIRSHDDLMKRKESLPIMTVWARYLRSNVLEFHADLRRHIDTLSPDRYIPLS